MNIDHFIQTNVPSYSGVALIVAENGGAQELAYGLANRSDRLANTMSTRFGIASGCKVFTAVAVAQLIRHHNLDFHSLLTDYLGGALPGFDPGITIHHLLTHSSGIPDYYDEAVMSDYEQVWAATPMYRMETCADFLPLFAQRQMRFTPGERFAYSDSGYIVLGLLVERLAGMSFQDYVRQHIFQPCGMTRSGYDRLDRLPEGTAIGYIDDGPTWRTNQYSIPVVGGPDGGAFTTAHDMDLFWNALLGGKLLSDSLTERLLQPHIAQNDYIHYGYGVWITILNGRIFKHFVTGSDPGVRMYSSVYSRGKLRAHILSNGQHGADKIAASIDEWLFRRLEETAGSDA